MTSPADRHAQLAAALRANLKRRKVAARGPTPAAGPDAQAEDGAGPGGEPVPNDPADPPPKP